MTELAVAVLLYGVAVLAIGLVATRSASRSPEEYFLAGRGLGVVVLFMALFGTNCTTFVLVGIPGMAHEHGIGVFGLNAAVIALGIPLTFWLVGAPARRLARELGALTPAELYAKRLGSRAVGLVLFAAFTVYTVPYMVQAVQGAGLVAAEATGGRVARWQAGAAVLAIALVYTSLGGMRATAWTNVLQGVVFLGFLLAAIVLVARSLGGPSAATALVAEHHPGHLARHEGWLFAPRAWASWGLVISLTVVGFPHMLARLMAATDERALRTVSRLYPLALAFLWVPAVLLGFWGAGAFPDLAEHDRIFQRMAEAHLPPALGVLSLLAVLAVVMSTLDAQLLTLSSMLVRDVLDPLRGAGAGADARQGRRGEVLAARLFCVGLAAVVLALAIAWSDDSVFAIARRAFEGYTTLVPTLLLGVRWPRFTAAGAIASVVVGNGLLALGWLGHLPTAGFLPVLLAFVGAAVAAVGVSLLDPAARPSPRPGTR